MGYLNLRPEQSNIFFKLMEERYRQHATIITTNLAYEEWYEFLGKKEMVKALLDRFCATAVTPSTSMGRRCATPRADRLPRAATPSDPTAVAPHRPRDTVPAAGDHHQGPRDPIRELTR